MLNIFLWILAPFGFGCLGLAMLTSLQTAILFGSLIFGVCLLAIRFNDRHTHLEYDDHLSQDRMRRVLDEYVQRVKRDSVVEN